MEYPRRLDGESDKAFLTRIMPGLLCPASLPEHHADYFECGGATILPMKALRTTKSARDNEVSSANAAKAMAAAKAGVVAKRAPLRVRPRSDGNFDILDGNATFTAGIYFGWVSIPVLVDSAPMTET